MPSIYVLPPRTLGMVIMALFALQGVFVLLSPGSLRLQRPEGGLVSWLYNIVNLSTLLLLTPLAALCLLRGWHTLLQWTSYPLAAGSVARALSGVGLALYVLGNLLTYWSRVVLGRSFRLGAVRPDQSDKLVTHGPFRLVRHPMYTAVAAMSLGLGLALSSWVFLVACALLLVTFVRLIPFEEAQLRQSYGEAYDAYCRRTRRLLPLVY